MSKVPTACKDCGNAAAQTRRGRCATCNSAYEAKRNADPRRLAYRDPRYLAQPRFGTCWICGKPGADTRDHVNGLTSLETRPAHRACNSGRRP